MCKLKVTSVFLSHVTFFRCEDTRVVRQIRDGLLAGCFRQLLMFCYGCVHLAVGERDHRFQNAPTAITDGEV